MKRIILKLIQWTESWLKYFFKIGILLFVVGICMNILVIQANNGKMPVMVMDIWKIDGPSHCMVDENTKFVWLCDWLGLITPHNNNALAKKFAKLIDFPDDVPVNAELFIASPGDIFRWVGLIVILLLFPILFTISLGRDIFKKIRARKELKK